MKFLRFSLMGLVFLILASGLYFGYTAWQKRQVKERPFVMVSLGDSLVEGVGASDQSKRFTSLLEAALRQKYPDATFYNFGTSGARVQQVVDLQLPQVAPIDPTLTLVVGGANDVTWNTDEEAFRAAWEVLLTQLSAKSERIVILSVPKIAATPIVPDALKDEADARTRRLNAVLYEVTQKYPKVAVFDFYGFSERELIPDNNLLFTDQFHPNDEGYARLANALEATIL